MVFVMTLLGLALLDLGAFESRLVLVDQANAQAFETAQAGIERGRWELQGAFQPDNNPLNDTPPCGPGGGACTDTGSFQDLHISDSDNSGSVRGGGFFELRVRRLTVSQVKDLDLSDPLLPGVKLECRNWSDWDGDLLPPPPIPLPILTPNEAICGDFILLLSTGRVQGPPGYVARRTIRIVLRAFDQRAVKVSVPGFEQRGWLECNRDADGQLETPRCR